MRLAACWPLTSPGPSVRLHCPARSMRCRPLWPIPRTSGFSATRRWTAALLAAIPGCGILHLSCHGFAELDNPLFSGLLLARDEIVNVADFLNLRLEGVRLVVLSACESGLFGTDLPSEAVGLSTSLLQAGAASVTATLWSVAGDSTLMTVARFYELLDHPMSDPYAALRLAQQWVRDTTNRQKAYHYQDCLRMPLLKTVPKEVARALYRSVILLPPESRDSAHPYHWASFSFIGS